MGYWSHSWQLNEVMVKTDSQVVPNRTLDDWNSYPTTKYTDKNDVHMHCVYCDYEFRVAAWPTSKYYCDLAPNINHYDENNDTYTCPSLPDPDPNAVWVDDEGNFVSMDMAPEEAKAQKQASKK